LFIVKTQKAKIKDFMKGSKYLRRENAWRREVEEEFRL
jgi:hypothetical protein